MVEAKLTGGYVDETRTKIIAFLRYMRWSNAQLDKAAGFSRGRVSYILRSPDSKIHMEEWNAIKRVIDERLPGGVDDPAPVPHQGKTVSAKDNLMLALVVFGTKTNDPELKTMCEELARAIMRSGQDTPH